MIFERFRSLFHRIRALEEEVEIQREVEEHLRQAILFLADVRNLKPGDWNDDRMKYIQPILGSSVIRRRYVYICDYCDFEWDKEMVKVCPRCKKNTKYVMLPSKRLGGLS